jgi:hypothetical protein
MFKKQQRKQDLTTHSIKTALFFFNLIKTMYALELNADPIT